MIWLTENVLVFQIVGSLILTDHIFASVFYFHAYRDK